MFEDPSVFVTVFEDPSVDISDIEVYRTRTQRLVIRGSGFNQAVRPILDFDPPLDSANLHLNVRMAENFTFWVCCQTTVPELHPSLHARTLVCGVVLLFRVSHMRVAQHCRILKLHLRVERQGDSGGGDSPLTIPLRFSFLCRSRVLRPMKSIRRSFSLQIPHASRQETLLRTKL